MAKVKVNHKQKLTSDDAAKAPPREMPENGEYLAKIVGVTGGVTKGIPPLKLINVDWQLVHQILEDKKTSTKWQGKHVWQNMILEHDASNPQWNSQRLYEIRMLVDATKIDYDDDGFDPDHLVGKTARIWIKSKRGEPQPGQSIEEAPVFTNIYKYDTESTDMEGIA